MTRLRSGRSKKSRRSVKASGAPATVAGLPVVRAINSSELSAAEREEERLRLRGMGPAERNALLPELVQELCHAGMFLNRVFMRNAIYRLQILTEEHAAALKLSPAESRDWLALASAAVVDREPINVRGHCEKLAMFWQNYFRSF